MKHFLLRFFLFSAMVYVLGLGVDYAISKGLLEMEDSRFQSWNDILNGDVNADIIYLGNSRALHHFEPWTIDSICGKSSYNLGIGGHAIMIETMKYHCYKLHNKKPKYLILQVDYYTIREGVAPKHHQSEQFLPLVYDYGMRDDLKRVGYGFLDLYCPLYRYFGYQTVIKNGLLEFSGIKHYVNNPSNKGHIYEDGKWDGTDLYARKELYARMDPAGMHYFESFLNECDKDGVKVILVHSPTYIGATKKTIGLDLANVFFDSLAKKHNTVYLNYANNYPLCNDTLNFCKAIHMNKKGTHRFSVDFANDLKALLE